ncbi:DUF5684 domain-containing protein [Microbacterium sp. Leaf159]|uniref:DUF5684 domain-containing protein n=1 Tax=Microbacterium sp. Leaf159 TaxID=1736279 RepID=UPI0006FD2023|nr:DUF5684 domain-containing protein [Microbacterium sp. Leaf159]KQR39529.1 hypothetical protein ASF80_09010 [Microbacterium sp. Leaf159]
MIAPVDAGYATMLAIVGGLGVLIGIAIYVWYAYALSRLFPRIDGEGWKGWVPILNEAEILARGGVPAWSVVFYFIPIVQLYGIYLKVVATHRINQRFGRGAGMTVLAILLPPVWATVLAWGAPPYPEGERLAALQPGPRRTSQPAAAPARDASGYTIPSLAPHAQSQPDAPALIFPDYAAPPRATTPAESAASVAPAAPSAWGAPPQAPQSPSVPSSMSPVGPPPVPGAQSPSSAPSAGQSPNIGAPAASFAPPAPQAAPQPPAPVPAPQPPAPQPPAPQPPAPQPPAPVVSPEPPVPSAAPQPPAPVEAHPTTGIMAAMGGEPVAPQPSAPVAAPQPPAPAPAATPQPPAPQPPAPFEDAPSVMPAAQFAPPASPDHGAADQSPAAPTPDPQRVVRPAPPSFRDGASDLEPQMPVIRPAPSATVDAPVAPAVPVAPAPVDPASVDPASFDSSDAAASPAAPMPLGGLAADVDKTVVTPRPAEIEVDDFDATVVVARKRGIRRSLVLDDGRKFSLSGASVVIGRNPIGEPGEQRLAISDTTRTLSKTHARLVVHDDEWRLTDLHATNGVVVVEENGTETLLDPGESVTGNGRFILGEVGMHVMAERDS